MSDSLALKYHNKIIDGKSYANNILLSLQDNLIAIKQHSNKIPKLAIILVGNNPASLLYVSNKIKAAQTIGISAVQIKLPESITKQEIINEIIKLNDDTSVSGIILQLPLPLTINKYEVLNYINPLKDVDGLTAVNVGYLCNNNQEKCFIPPTALGCMKLIKSRIQNLQGVNVAIVGRSELVGKPVMNLLIAENATITLCHSKSINLYSITSRCDVVIIATGLPRFFTSEYFNDNAVIIDVGINKVTQDGTIKIVGDVDFDSVISKVKYITPVPGGVGPMTVACLLKNTIKAFCIQNKISYENH